MKQEKEKHFQSLSNGIGVFNAENKRFLIPEMNRYGAHLVAAACRSFGIRAEVLETCAGMDFGREYTSGKECLPCLITTGDILHYLHAEKERLGDRFNPEEYIIFMPESDGPCRFGMYNKYQRLVLDSFPDLAGVRIGSLTSRDGYSVAGMIEKERTQAFRKAVYHAILFADILERLLWRIRPYEREKGSAEMFLDKSLREIAASFEEFGAKNDFRELTARLEEAARKAREILDYDLPRKPAVGIVGEIFLRTHHQSNQQLIRVLEKYGAEVINASITEWINYIAYHRMREAKKELRTCLKQLRIRKGLKHLKKILSFALTLLYQQNKQRKIYRRIMKIVDIAGDHRVAHLDRILEKNDVFSFDVGTEACLSISGLIAYAEQGFNGVVNVYPFTCMPGTVTSSIARPLLANYRVPYLDASYDTGSLPGREAAIRTYMYQVYQHYQRNRRRGPGEKREKNYSAPGTVSSAKFI